MITMMTAKNGHIEHAIFNTIFLTKLGLLYDSKFITTN